MDSFKFESDYLQKSLLNSLVIDENEDFIRETMQFMDDPIENQSSDTNSPGRISEFIGNLSLNVSNRSETMRTLYFGNLPTHITFESFLNHIKGGIIENVKLFPERNCAFITFLEASSATAIFAESQVRRFCILRQEVRIGWGKPSSPPSFVLNAVHQGATRNVFLGNLDPSAMNPEYLISVFSQFGPVDCIRILDDKRIAFIHMTSISNAIKAVHALSTNDEWQNRRIYYGKDRCASPNVPKNSFDVKNRTIYIGGIAPDVTAKDLCDVIRGGILQNIKYFCQKNIAFITFIYEDEAEAFFNRTLEQGLAVKGKRVKIGWGKPSTLPLFLQEFVNNGATRNVYIGGIDDSITEEQLHADFCTFGEIELVNIVPERSIGFVNFMDISSAIRAVDVMRNLGKYSNLKINYGKDRCGNPPRIKEIIPDLMLSLNDEYL